MGTVNAIKLKGIWDEGYALDKYIKSSVFKGTDVFGHNVFENTYTDIGKLLYSIKYNGHFDTSNKIADYGISFVSEWLSDKGVDIILPIPPTSRREFQPVFLIAHAFASRLGLYYSENVLINTSNVPTKSVPKSERQSVGKISKIKEAKRLCNILLIDDFYSTGTTATECVSALKTDKFIDKVYYLAIAMTK